MYDVAIIGGGISGCSLLYQLAKTQLKVVLLEKENDLCMGTTKANSAIVHAGYDPQPGTLMARSTVKGNSMIHSLCEKLDVPFKNTGSLVLAFNEEQLAQLEVLLRQGETNGVPGLVLWDEKTLHSREPSVSPQAIAALYAPTAGVVSPWELTLAQAETALRAGAEARLDTAVQDILKCEDGFTLQTGNGEIRARYVVNAAGIQADSIYSMALAGAKGRTASKGNTGEGTAADGAPGDTTPQKAQGSGGFTIQPNRGEYFLLDTTQGSLVQHIIFQCPGPGGKGVLVAPTVHGNLIVGPSSQPVDAPSTATTAAGLEGVRAAALRSVPGISFRDNIRSFAGLRAIADADDFIVGEAPALPGFFNIAGIKSPGLTAAPALAVEVAAALLQKPGMPYGANPRFEARRRVLRFKQLDAAARAAVIAQNPLYGTIVCRCETITEGEIVNALRSPLPPRSLDGVKRRCSAGMGRCQGGFCGPRVQAIIARELQLNPACIPQEAEGSYIVTGETKAPQRREHRQ